MGGLFGGGGGGGGSSGALTGASKKPTTTTTPTVVTKPLTVSSSGSTAPDVTVPVSTPTVVAPVTGTVMTTTPAPVRVANDFINSTPTVVAPDAIPATQTETPVASDDLTGSLKRKKRGYGVSSVLGF